jgi:hypothetical protein
MVERTVRAVEQRFHVSIAWRKHEWDALQFPRGVQIQEAHGSAILKTLRLLCWELEPYRLALSMGLGVNRIGVVREVRIAGRQHISVALPVHGTMLFQASAECGVCVAERRAIHHEVFHMMEHAMRFDGAEALIASWPVRVESRPAVGYISDYARESPAEDRAEVYACMVVEPDHISTLARVDEIIRQKKDLIAEHVSAWSLGIDPAWWAAVRARN